MSATSILVSLVNTRAIAALVREKIAFLLRADQRYRDARHLSRLDNRMLRDIGITRAQADSEIRRLRSRSATASHSALSDR